MNSRTAYWADLYDQGLSLRAVASRVGVTHKTVLDAFRSEGVARRPRQQGHNAPPRGNPPQKPWAIGWCNECSEERKLNPKTGWCKPCSMRAQASAQPISRMET